MKNLFEYGKKELTQDAIVAWLLDSDDPDFSKSFLFSMCSELAKIIGNKKITKLNVSTQTESIDILVEVEVEGDKLIAVIIEDKTDTYLHNFQMLKYIEKIADKGTKKNPKYQSVHFVLFKTGDIYAWEQEDYNYWQCKINKKERQFSADDLNKRVDGVLASDSYTKTNIEFKKVENIVVENIYTLTKFKDFLKNNKIKSNEYSDVLEYYKKYLENKEQDDNKDKEIYDTLKTYVEKYNKTNEEKALHKEMVKPGGGGKREYEYNFLSKEMIVEKNDKKFIVLPFIVKKEVKVDNKTAYQYQFTIHCHIAANENKLFGYLPWSQLQKNEKTAFSYFKKQVYDKFRNDLPDWSVNDQFETSNGDGEDEKNNGLQLCKFEGDLTETNLDKLIDTAKKIANAMRNNNQ